MLSSLTRRSYARTFSLSAENPDGKKGGARATEGNAAYHARELGEGWKVSPNAKLPAKTNVTLADIKGQGAIKHIWMTDICSRGRALILRIYFDGQSSPAVCAPLSDFFANADYTEYRQLSSLAMCINPYKGLNCYFEMPYRNGFRIDIENVASEDVLLWYQIDCEEKPVPEDSLYFHAQFRRANPVPYMEPYTILENVKGCGQYVGTYINYCPHSNGWWGEGEIKFYIDGDGEYPTICGTGTEDYFGGSHNFEADGKYAEFSTPYSGMYKVSRTDDLYKVERRFNMYRWHIVDPIYFKEDLRVTIQALGWRSGGRYRPLTDDITSVAYWYSDNLADEYPPLPSPDELELF